jgi:serine/threonine-protein kinase
MTSRSSPPSTDSEPEVLYAGLATYEYVRSLGQANHGEWMLARQRYNGRLCGHAVLKRLNPVVREQDYHRLLEEGQLGGQLRHDNLVSVRHMEGTVDSPVLILEYIPGRRLSEVFTLARRAGRVLTEELACFVIAEVAEGLHHAHACVDEEGRSLGIVHRDVTPYNILLSARGEVKLADFGVAWSRLQGRMTSEGDNYPGSLAYSSPERTALEHVDGRSDLFSLGVILLQLLTGAHLFAASERFEAELRSRQLRAQQDLSHLGQTPGLEEMGAYRTRFLMRHIRNLTVESIQLATRGLPERLQPILHKALAPRREARYAHGAELSAALREYLGQGGKRFGREVVAEQVAALAESAVRRLEGGAAPVKAPPRDKQKP